MPSRPPSNLPSPSLRWQRSIESDLENLLRSSAQQENTGSINNRGAKNSMAGAMRAIAALQAQNAQIIAQNEAIAAQNTAIAQQQALIVQAQKDLVTQNAAIVAQNNTIQAQQALLTDVANVQQGSFVNANGITGFTGFYTGTRPSVTLSTQSGRITLSFGGTLNSGNGVFAYGVTRNDTGATVVSRTSVQADYARRVAISGGASFTPSGFSSVVLTGLPRNVSLTIQLEMYAYTNTVYFYGGNVLANPSL